MKAFNIFFMLPLLTLYSINASSSDAADDHYCNNAIDSCPINKLEDAKLVLKRKRTLSHDEKKELLTKKEYSKYLAIEKNANNAWLKYINDECRSKLFGYAHIDSPAYNELIDACMLDKYKARINDNFLERK